MPDPKQRSIKEDPYHKDQFTYDEDNDCYYCPRGQTLPFLRNSRKRGEWVRIYRASRLVCKECPALGVCTKNRRKGRALELGPYDAVSRRHRAWMETEEAKRVYKLRKQLVEPVFGIIKEQQGARRFLLRGLANVSPNGRRWPQHSTCAPSGRYGTPDPAPLLNYPTVWSLAPLSDRYPGLENDPYSHRFTTPLVPPHGSLVESMRRHYVIQPL